MTTLNVNGRPVQVSVDPDTPLLWVLREDLEQHHDLEEVRALLGHARLDSDVVTPTLVVIGDADHDTPNAGVNCATAVERLRRAGRPVGIKLYPGAVYGFDQPGRYDAEVTRDAMATALAFFDQHLGRRAAGPR